MTTERYYKPELDVLRLCAFLFVFFAHRLDLAPVDIDKYYWGYHISLVGNYGVPLFFFLSAFLITELLSKEQKRFGKISVRYFYIRRILRIWPLYLTFFFLVVLLTSVTPHFGGKIPPKAQLAFSLFSGNWYITFNGWQSYCINPLWSVSVEEQLYILLPLVIYFTGKKGLKIFSFSAIIIAYITIVYYACSPTEGFNGQWTNSSVQFQFFAAGILTSVYLHERQPILSFPTRLCLFILGYACWLTASMLCEVNADAPHMATVIQSTGGWFLILLGVMFFFFSFFGSSTKWMPSKLAYLGRISYGMYVFHITIYWIIFHILKRQLSVVSDKMGLSEWQNEIGVVAVFLITVSIALLSYNYFEKIFLRLKKRFTFVTSRD